ncbi:hypothetical protein [Arthrobacter sp. CJ23]|uniref:hypothetical protein n=1 Tax=Arthrobacter sp. CJ23 TaxID=2972479 RepID=UPI00215C4D6C|nr:hypothetical protein [Arthrobacter sp. CJ23]UVJ38031.1 hypothetical protein NVV90_12245 [Arthrobacter sp. CJ23]
MPLNVTSRRSAIKLSMAGLAMAGITSCSVSGGIAAAGQGEFPPRTIGDARRVDDNEGFAVWKALPQSDEAAKKNRTTEEFLTTVKDGVVRTLQSLGFKDTDLARVESVALYVRGDQQAGAGSSPEGNHGLAMLAAVTFPDGYKVDQQALLDSAKQSVPGGTPGKEQSWCDATGYFGFGVSRIVIASGSAGASEEAALKAMVDLSAAVVDSGYLK